MNIGSAAAPTVTRSRESYPLALIALFSSSQLCTHSPEHLSPSSPSCYIEAVKILPAIGRLLCILASIGLIIAPIGRPAMATAAVIQPDIADHAVADHADMAMPQDMPCCPKKAAIPIAARIVWRSAPASFFTISRQQRSSSHLSWQTCFCRPMSGAWSG